MAKLYFQMAASRGTTSATEVIQPQTELNMFILVLYDVFSRMNTKEQRRAQKDLTALMIVATGESDLKSKLNLWWRTLRRATGIIEGKV